MDPSLDWTGRWSVKDNQCLANINKTSNVLMDQSGIYVLAEWQCQAASSS